MTPPSARATGLANPGEGYRPAAAAGFGGAGVGDQVLRRLSRILPAMRVHRRGTTQAAILLACVAWLLAACGSEDATPVATDQSADTAAATSSESASGSAAPSDEVPADAPACSDVWVAGQKLARGYQGCTDGDTYVPRDTVICSSGQKMVRYADHFYGVLGGTIHQTDGVLTKDREYRKAERSCTA
jgi:hypothetical protein